jgi:hypothetical protein
MDEKLRNLCCSQARHARGISLPSVSLQTAMRVLLSPDHIDLKQANCCRRDAERDDYPDRNHSGEHEAILPIVVLAKSIEVPRRLKRSIAM